MRGLRPRKTLLTGLLVTSLAAPIVGRPAAVAQSSGGAPAPAADAPVVVGAADCTAAKLGTDIPTARIGEPVSRVTLSATWVAETATSPAFCRVDGILAAVDPAPTSRPINFAVVLPASWNRRAVQLGGGGFNGTIPNLTGGARLRHLRQRFGAPGAHRTRTPWRRRSRGGTRDGTQHVGRLDAQRRGDG